MDLQKQVLQQYLILNHGPTLKKISEDTGIQFTRCFRLLNGSEMKLKEFEIFKKKIAEKLGLKSTLEEMVMECSLSLSKESISELEDIIRRKLKLLKIQNETKKINEQVIA